VASEKVHDLLPARQKPRFGIAARIPNQRDAIDRHAHPSFSKAGPAPGKFLRQ
jgi:hypothetical protein